MTAQEVKVKVGKITQLRLGALKSIKVGDGVSYLKITRQNIIEYCERYCPNYKDGCAINCSIRKRLKIPPHGDHY